MVSSILTCAIFQDGHGTLATTGRSDFTSGSPALPQTRERLSAISCRHHAQGRGSGAAVILFFGHSRCHGGRSAVKSSGGRLAIGASWLRARLFFGRRIGLSSGLLVSRAKDDWIVEWDPGHLRQHSWCFPGLLLDIFGRISGVFPGLLGSSAAFLVFSLDWEVWQVAEFILLVESSCLCLRGFSEALSEGFPAVCCALVADVGDLCLLLTAALDVGIGPASKPDVMSPSLFP